MLLQLQTVGQRHIDDDEFDVIEEEFTYARMVQGISHLKEYQKKKAAIHSKEGEIHFD